MPKLKDVGITVANTLCSLQCYFISTDSTKNRKYFLLAQSQLSMGCINIYIYTHTHIYLAVSYLDCSLGESSGTFVSKQALNSKNDQIKWLQFKLWFPEYCTTGLYRLQYKD